MKKILTALFLASFVGAVPAQAEIPPGKSRNTQRLKHPTPQSLWSLGVLAISSFLSVGLGATSTLFWPHESGQKTVAHALPRE